MTTWPSKRSGSLWMAGVDPPRQSSSTGSHARLPAELTYQKNGVMFGNRLIQASRMVNVADPQLRTDLIAFVYNCTLYDLQDGTIDPAAFARSIDIWSLMGSPNPARFSTPRHVFRR